MQDYLRKKDIFKNVYTPDKPETSSSYTPDLLKRPQEHKAFDDINKSNRAGILAKELGAPSFIVGKRNDLNKTQKAIHDKQRGMTDEEVILQDAKKDYADKNIKMDKEKLLRKLNSMRIA